MIGHQHGFLGRIFANDHGLPSVFLVEFQDCAVAGGIRNHIVIAGSDGGIMPDIQRCGEVQGLLHGGAAVQPEAHDDSRADLVTAAFLACGLPRKGHYGCAEALFVDSVNGCIDGCEAIDLLREL